MSQKVITTLIEVLIFAAIIGSVATGVATAVLNLSGTASLLVGMVTLIVAAGFLISQAKSWGLMGGRK